MLAAPSLGQDDVLTTAFNEAFLDFIHPALGKVLKVTLLITLSVKAVRMAFNVDFHVGIICEPFSDCAAGLETFLVHLLAVLDEGDLLGIQKLLYLVPNQILGLAGWRRRALLHWLR